jgi:processive 1,2-diacylglycerol beta-glucosyltransferase
VDVLALSPGPGRFLYNWIYLFLVRRAGWLWKFGYAFLDLRVVYAVLRPLRLGWNLWMARGFVASVKTRPPDIVLVTHFLPADVLAAGRRAGWLKAPLVVVVTDLYPHRFWSVEGADAVVVSVEEGERALRQRHPGLRQVVVAGIPVDPAFGRAVDAAASRQALGLLPDRFTVLVTSGGTTVGQFEAVVAAVAGLDAVLPGKAQLLVVCGQDQPAASRLKAQAAGWTMPVPIYGFVENMSDLMAASDLIVCKAGGLTVSEALDRHLPLIVYHVIPGQEQLNAEHTARAGAALIAPRPQEVAEAVHGLLEHPDRLAAMRRAVEVIRRPSAADDVVAKVALPLLSQRFQVSS